MNMITRSWSIKNCVYLLPNQDALLIRTLSEMSILETLHFRVCSYLQVHVLYDLTWLICPLVSIIEGQLRTVIEV